MIVTLYKGIQILSGASTISGLDIMYARYGDLSIQVRYDSSDMVEIMNALKNIKSEIDKIKR